jgi:mRNA interferase MazF
MPKVKRFSVYWFDPEPTLGSEIRKIRPAVVISPDEMNDKLRTVLVAPLTSTTKPWPFRVSARILGKRSSIACDQLKAADKSRLREHISELSSDDAESVLRVLRQIFSQ